MAAWVLPAIGAGVGAIGGLLGRNRNPTTSSSGQSSSASSSQNQSSWVPNQAATPLYGMLAQQSQTLGQTPQNFFPGQTYVDPSAPTQIGTALQMGSIPAWMMGAQQAGGAAGIAGQNYGELSGQQMTDVAQNPYVQAMMGANQQQVQEGLLRNMLPAINQQFESGNNLGSSRQGLMQGQAVGDAAQSLANANASTMLNAYGQGLQTRLGALGQLGGVQQGYGAPAGMLGQAAGQAYQAGQGVEGYQQAALQDAMDRFNFQYQEPMRRLDILQQGMNALQPLGTNYGSGTSYTQGANVGTAPNPAYQSPFQAAFGGAIGGAGMGMYGQQQGWFGGGQQAMRPIGLDFGQHAASLGRQMY